MWVAGCGWGSFDQSGQIFITTTTPPLVRAPTHTTKERGATIIYATHIFDGLESWPTHLAYVEGGRMLRGEALLPPLPHRTCCAV